MFKHILVPMDLTDRGMNALAIAVKMALHDASRITLLHVIEMIQDSESEEFEGFYKKLERRAVKAMDKMLGLYQYEQLQLEKKIVYGRRVGEILRFADAEGVDLIVLSSHRIEPENPVQGWGTISYKVGILAHCPVMLVK